MDLSLTRATIITWITREYVKEAAATIMPEIPRIVGRAVIMDLAYKQKALKQLARMGGEITQAALDKEAEKIASALATETQYDHLEAHLQLLETISYRVVEKTVETIKNLLTRLENLELTYPETLWFPKEQLSKYQTSEKLIIKSLETLEHVRYLKLNDILEIFFRYSTYLGPGVAEQAKHGIETTASFNLDIYYGHGEDRPGVGWYPKKDA